MMPPEDEYERIPLDKLKVGEFYDVKVDILTFWDVKVRMSTIFQGRKPDGTLIFADGPNAIEIDPDDSIVEVWYDHIPF